MSDNVLFKDLSANLKDIKDESSRNKKVEKFASFLDKAIQSPRTLIATVWLTLNKVGPNSEGVSVKLEDKKLFPEYMEAEITVEPLTVVEVHEKLWNAARLPRNPEGNEARRQAIGDLARRCSTRLEYSCLERHLCECSQKLNFAEAGICEALGVVFAKRFRGADVGKHIQEEYGKLLLNAYNKCPDFGIIINDVHYNGVENISTRIQIQAGIPVCLMLAEKCTEKTLLPAKFSCEPKISSFRAQIHCLSTGEVRIFDRNLFDITTKNLEIATAVLGFVREKSIDFIVDGVIEDPHAKEKKFSSPKLRNPGQERSEDIKAHFFAFDLLQYKGERIWSKPYQERSELLRTNFVEVPNIISFIAYEDCNNLEELQESFSRFVEAGSNGVIVKDLASKYEFGKHSKSGSSSRRSLNTCES
ncbi:hypothetical protein QR680_015249 [Steinernema hermaphroditum]|uniref:ATP-dependent DNA ligase family profile domain-containing protein n=1 Tax=Steinernema hermaphroditum TaxID=289476 RepID=A0AA39H729_9BILA|nr:hypothetical protein QR680_015249 [Steinernema hermaphroditum]